MQKKGKEKSKERGRRKVLRRKWEIKDQENEERKERTEAYENTEGLYRYM